MKLIPLTLAITLSCLLPSSAFATCMFQVPGTDNFIDLKKLVTVKLEHSASGVKREKSVGARYVMSNGKVYVPGYLTTQIEGSQDLYWKPVEKRRDECGIKNKIKKVEK